MRPQLRVFHGDDQHRLASEIEHGGQIFQHPALKPVPVPATVSVRLGDILEPLAEAVDSNRAFLKDFADEHIAMSSDLYEILMAFHQLRASA